MDKHGPSELIVFAVVTKWVFSLMPPPPLLLLAACKWAVPSRVADDMRFYRSLTLTRTKRSAPSRIISVMKVGERFA